MQKSKTRRPLAKNSNLRSPQPKKVDEPFVLNEDSTIIVKITQQGRFKTFGYDQTLTKSERKALKKDEIAKMKRSWCLKEEGKKKYTSRDGSNWRLLGQNEKVKNYFTSHSEHFDSTTDKVELVKKLPGSFGLFAISDEGRPFSIKKSEWDAYPKRFRLLCVCNTFVENGEELTSVEVVN